MAEGDETPCLCEFPGCRRKYLNEHSRRQHYRRVHGPEWSNRAVRRRQKSRAKANVVNDATNPSCNLSCRRPSTGRTATSLSPTAQRRAAPQHYRAFSTDHAGAPHAADMGPEWMLRSYDDDFVAANCRYLAMLRNQVPQPNFLVGNPMHKAPHTQAMGIANSGVSDMSKQQQHVKRNGEWELLDRDPESTHFPTHGLELPGQYSHMDHQNRDFLWSRKILGQTDRHAEVQNALSSAGQGSRGDMRMKFESELTYNPSAMAHVYQPGWLETNETVTTQCVYRSRTHSFSADNLVSSIQAKGPVQQSNVRDQNHCTQYPAARALSSNMVQNCYQQDLDKTDMNAGHMDPMVSREGGPYRMQDSANMMMDSMQSRDNLLNLPHTSPWATIAQRQGNVMAGQGQFEVEATTYTGYAGEVISMAHHGLTAPSDAKPNDMSRLRLHHSKALISIFPPTPIEI